MKKSLSKDILFGVATGDAIGVPVEFWDRARIKERPVLDMRGYGTHNLPAGTWSDDSSLTFCLAEALTQQFDMEVVSGNFQRWLYEGYWTPYGSVFDIGIATKTAIFRLKQGIRPDIAGGFFEEDNGNGSLMRILPLLLYIKEKPIQERFAITKVASSITHGHIRSVISCFYYLEFARLLTEGIDKFDAYNSLQRIVTGYLNSISVNPEEIAFFLG